MTTAKDPMPLSAEDMERAHKLIEHLKARIPEVPSMKDVYIEKDLMSVVFESNVGGNMRFPIRAFLRLYTLIH